MSSHEGFHRTYNQILNSIYMKNLVQCLHLYISHCPDCQLNQTKRHLLYESLILIDTAPILFYCITIDFIVTLPLTCEEENSLVTITCKFTKWLLLLSGQETYTAEDWADKVITGLLRHEWGISRSIISNWDSKFMSSFWRAIFNKLNVQLLMLTAYYLQTDRQLERFNQSVKIDLWYFLTQYPNEKWMTVLPYLQFMFNNFKNAFTDLSLNDVLYKHKANDNLNLLSDLLNDDAENWGRLHIIKCQQAEDTISFTNTMSKIRYDIKHKPLDLKVSDMIYLWLHHGYYISELPNQKLSSQ